jgi:hypothetical protein
MIHLILISGIEDYKMSKKVELSFDDWLERYDLSEKENNIYKDSLKKLNNKIKENNSLIKGKRDIAN